MREAFYIFEGGGAKGLAHVGALKAAETRQIKLIGIAGTSAGVIVASEIDNQKITIFSKEKTPNKFVATAVAASITIQGSSKRVCVVDTKNPVPGGDQSLVTIRSRLL